MANCTNCGKKLGCSCKKRTASNGKSCCAYCLPNLEKTLKKGKATKASPTVHKPGVILSATAVQTN